MKKQKYIPLIVAAVFIILVLISTFIEIPYTVSSWGKILPQKEWLLTRGTDGELISRLYNNKHSVNEEYSVSQISRGEETYYALNDAVLRTNFIHIGDTIATVKSSAAELKYTELSGRLMVEKASLAAMKKGEKAAVIKKAEENLNFSKAKAYRHKIQVDRLIELAKNKLVADEDLELAKAKMDELNYEVKIADSQLEIVKSGVKLEELNLAEMRIKALEDERVVLENKMNSYVITSPIAGTISRTFGSDTLLIISDESEFVMLLPISQQDQKYFDEDVNLKIPVLQSENEFPVKLRYTNHVEFLNNNPVRYASSVISNPGKDLISGMLMPVELTGKDILLFDYILKMLN